MDLKTVAVATAVFVTLACCTPLAINMDSHMTDLQNNLNEDELMDEEQTTPEDPTVPTPDDSTVPTPDETPDTPETPAPEIPSSAFHDTLDPGVEGPTTVSVVNTTYVGTDPEPEQP